MRSDCGGIQCDSLISLDSVSSLNCPVAAGFRPVAQTNTVISRSFSPQTGGYVSLPWFQWHAVARPGRASSHYDEWWASIIPVWKQPLLLWLSLANEGCIIHPLVFFFFTHTFSLCCSPLLSLTSLSASLPVLVCIVGVVIRSPQHPDLMPWGVVWCFSVSLTECSRSRLGTESAPNGFAVPATALSAPKSCSARWDQSHP